MGLLNTFKKDFYLAILKIRIFQLNPLLNAAAQQFAVDTTRAWANAAAAAALFASQLQQQNSGSSNTGAQQQLQQAAALNLVSLQNFPFVDYARMMHVPNRNFYHCLKEKTV